MLQACRCDHDNTSGFPRRHIPGRIWARQKRFPAKHFFTRAGTLGAIMASSATLWLDYVIDIVDFIHAK